MKSSEDVTRIREFISFKDNMSREETQSIFQELFDYINPFWQVTPSEEYTVIQYIQDLQSYIADACFELVENLQKTACDTIYFFSTNIELVVRVCAHSIYCKGAVVLFAVIFAVLAFMKLCCSRTIRKRFTREQSLNKNCKNSHVKLLNENSKDHIYGTVTLFHAISRLTLLTFGLALLITIPWEFIRLYQVEIAKKASIVNQGKPAACEPDLSIWQSVKAWFLWHFSWGHSQCEQYYTALMVDPLWEVTPLVVVMSGFSRCVVHPIEALSKSLGRCVKLLFEEIPLQWQPVLMVIFGITVLISTVMICRYRVSMPFFLNIEPFHKSPCVVKQRGGCEDNTVDYKGDSTRFILCKR